LEPATGGRTGRPDDVRFYRLTTDPQPTFDGTLAMAGALQAVTFASKLAFLARSLF
jgi:hypothetical protein